MAGQKNNGRLIEERPIAELVPYARNSRMHSDLQIAKLQAAIPSPSRPEPQPDNDNWPDDGGDAVHPSAGGKR